MMKDSAKGPSSGYIYQFEIALLELTQLNINESISIEKVDDIAKEDAKGTFICTIQAKHSISLSGSNFGNTSEDLWKTLNIWIEKLNKGILTKENNFYAVTNKTIPNNSIIRSFNKHSFDTIVDEIEAIKKKQKEDYDKKITKGEKGASIKKTISRIENVLLNKDKLEIIIKNFQIKEGLDNVKNDFLSKINFVTLESAEKKDAIYQSFLGWITDTSKECWKNKKEAKFSKSDFEAKFRLITGNHNLVDAIFRTKNKLETSNPIDLNKIDKNKLFIKQLVDINREFNEDIIKEAVLDFILCEIEITHFITNTQGNYLTRTDFEDFEKKCEDSWNRIKRKFILNKINTYSTEELNVIACKIYDAIMYDLKLEFQDCYGFNDTNKYIQNGTFLKLSDEPRIGWNPEWEKIYK